MAVSTRSGGWTYRTPNGTTGSWVLQERDVQIIRALNRWHTLNASTLSQILTSPTRWYPPLMPEANPGVEGGGVITRGVEHAPVDKLIVFHMRNIRRRLTLLARNHPHPLIVGARMTGNETAWRSTRHGGRVSGIEWEKTKTEVGTNAMKLSDHAIEAARVGTCLERNGWRVLSEREVLHGVALDEGPIPVQLRSQWRGNDGRNVTKLPDLAVPDATGQTWVALEVERTKHRPMATYLTKFAAYRANPSIRGVLYVTASDTIRTTVLTAAARVWGGDRNPVMVARFSDDPFMPIPIDGSESLRKLLGQHTRTPWKPNTQEGRN